MQSQPLLTDNLLRDLKAEGCCGKSFTPSVALVEEYGLREDNGTYYIGGFLQVGTQATPADIAKFGVSVGTQIDSTWTVQIPVQNLESLLKTKGIKTFDMGRKVQMKRRGIGL